MGIKDLVKTGRYGFDFMLDPGILPGYLMTVFW